ncbi:Gamma-glutamylputrescine oxidoreductase [Marinibacterium anthonyi]|nr:Gamma-glutamylputrescine oxidoreductase [Marinibacterium anthonyi]
MAETAENSLYLNKAGPAPAWSRLEDALHVPVAIVGGGLTGLSTALHLAESGVQAAVFEAESPGWGASGRNGGQLNPGLKFDPSWFISRFGEARGREMIGFGWSTVDETVALINRLGIDCDLRRNGTLRAAASARDVASVRRSFDDMTAHAMDVAWLDQADVAALTGHERYPAAFLDRRGGDLNPLLFSRGLAVAAQAAGAKVFGDSRVRSLGKTADGWRLEVNGQTVRADRVLIACNGYADGLWPGLRQASVPVFSSVLASHPLSEDMAKTVMPGRQVLYESGLVTVYYRVDSAGHLIIGGRGPMRPSSDARRMQAIARHAEKLWPGVSRAGWQFAWNGRVSVTPDHLPNIHAPDPSILIAYGYNGRGVALSTALGRHLAACLSGRIAPDDLPLPPSNLRRIPFHRFWPVGVHLTVAASRLRSGFFRQIAK